MWMHPQSSLWSTSSDDFDILRGNEVYILAAVSWRRKQCAPFCWVTLIGEDFLLSSSSAGGNQEVVLAMMSGPILEYLEWNSCVFYSATSH